MHGFAGGQCFMLVSPSAQETNRWPRVVAGTDQLSTTPERVSLAFFLGRVLSRRPSAAT